MMEAFSKSVGWSCEQAWFAICPHDVSKMIFFLVLKALPILPVEVHVVLQTIGTMNFVHNVCLQIQQKSMIWGLELLLQGDQWFTY